MSTLLRSVSNTSLKFKTGLHHVLRFSSTLQSTSTDSTPATMELDSESQEEDQG